jgi:NAD-dependent dihydropyrimidine dehydrogenase PreA subunit
VPIARDFRIKWSVISKHEGHPVWRKDNIDAGTIHGNIVGVHLESCNGCMRCIEACPTSVFVSWINKTGHEVVDPISESECIYCLVCELVCPTDAISVVREPGSQDTLESLLRDDEEY